MAKYRALSVIAALLAVALFLPSAGIAADAKCEPDKLATKYPSLVGKTIKIGTDGETPPYAMRDPKDFSQLIGLDTEIAQGAFRSSIQRRDHPGRHSLGDPNTGD